jgi:signal transduction histidine kinase
MSLPKILMECWNVWKILLTQKHFVSNISHELRTPLSAIITELELASEKN